MIIEETLDFLRSHDAERMESLVIQEVSIGVYLTAVRLSDGSVGVASTHGSDNPDARNNNRRFGHFSPLHIRQQKAMDLLLSDDHQPITSSLRLATLNALSVPWILNGNHKVHMDKDPIDMIDRNENTKLVLVGAFQSYIRKLINEAHHFKVLELSIDALAPQHQHLFVSSDKSSEVIPEADVVIITGMTLLNHTADQLLEMTHSHQQVVVSGPSGSILPEVLFRRNVSLIGATQVTDPERLMDLVREAGAGYHLFKYCARKICITPASHGS